MELTGMKAFITFLSWIYLASSLSSEMAIKGACNMDVIWPNDQKEATRRKEHLQSRLNTPEKIENFIVEYHGIPGHRQAALQFTIRGNLRRVFDLVRQFIGNHQNFRKLGWHRFEGKIEDQDRLLSLILNSDGTVNMDYRGPEGRTKLSADYGVKYEQMAELVYASIGDEKSAALKWRKTGRNYRTARAKINQFTNLISTAEKRKQFVEQYRGLEGQRTIATDFFGGSLNWAYNKVHALIREKHLLALLDWKQFVGTVEEQDQLLNVLLNSDGTVKKDYMWKSGLGRLSSLLGIEETKLKQMVYSSLQESSYTALRWGVAVSRSRGEADRKLKEFQEFLEGKDQETVRTALHGMENYRQISDEYFAGNMDAAFSYINKNSTKLLGGPPGKMIAWRKFRGTTKEQDLLLSTILNAHGVPKQEYIGKDRSYKIAAKFTWTLEQAFDNTSNSLGKEVFNNLQWKRIRSSITADIVNSLRAMSDKEIKQSFRNLFGQVKAANRFSKSNLQNAYDLFSTFLPPELFEELGWIRPMASPVKFIGNKQEDKAYLLSVIFNPDGTFKEEYMGIYGLHELASYVDWSLDKVFRNASVLLQQDLSKLFGWSLVRATAEAVDDLLQMSEKEIRQSFSGANGKRKAAKRFTQGNIGGVEELFSAFLSDFGLVEELGWN